MQTLFAFSANEFSKTAICFFVAFILGTLIGAERQYRQRAAGLRTNVFVAVGAAAFVDLGQRVGGSAESVRVISYVVSGIGFLGAGVIMKDGMNVRGLNTAATLWCSAAVGACSGSGLLAEAALLTGFIIIGNTCLRYVVNSIDRLPINAQMSEASFEFRFVVVKNEAVALRAIIKDMLEMANFQVSDAECLDLSADSIALVFNVVGRTAIKSDIEHIIKIIERRPGVLHIHWIEKSRE